MGDMVTEAFRNCITYQKCNNKDCPYESRCEICNNSTQYLQIPKHLALDVLNKLKEQELEIDELYERLEGM